MTLEWVSQNGGNIASAFGGVVLLATFLNSALTYAPRGKGALEWFKWGIRSIVDFAAFRAQKGAHGMGATRWSVPFVTVSKPDGAKSGGGESGKNDGGGPAVVLVFASAAVVVSLQGCASWEVTAYRGTGLVANAAAIIVKALPERCEAAQKSAVRAPAIANLPTMEERNDAGHKAVERVTEQCATAGKGLEVVSGGIKLAIDGIDDARKLSEAPSDKLQWLRTAFHAWEDLAPILRTLGVDVPYIQLPEVP